MGARVSAGGAGIKRVIAQVVAAGVLVVAVAAALAFVPTGTGALRDLSPADRSVHLSGSGCHGKAGGSGTLVGDDVVLASGHVVDGLEEIDVMINGAVVAARVTHVDAKLDVAVLRLGPTYAYRPMQFGDAGAGDSGTIYVRDVDGAVVSKPYRVSRRIRAQTESVGRDEIVERRSLQIDAPVQRGDSGAILFDTDERGVGLVWSTSRNLDDVGYAVRGDELPGVLADERAAPSGPRRCS